MGYAPGGFTAPGVAHTTRVMTPTEYVTDIKAALIACHLVTAFDIVEEWVQPDRGYLRVRARLCNGDFLEVAEYFVVWEGRCVPERYRYQWMDGNQERLVRRWDNVEHYPELPGFPHHIHLADERVVTGESLSILDFLGQLINAIPKDAHDHKLEIAENFSEICGK